MKRLPKFIRASLVVVLGMLGIDSHAQMSPPEGERPWGQDRLRYWLDREVIEGPEVPDEFPEIKIFREPAGEIRAEFPRADHRNVWPGIEILRADANGRIALPGGGSISIAALATAYHNGRGKQERAPNWRHPIRHQPLDASTVEALGIPDGRKDLRRHSPQLGSQAKFVLRSEGVDNVLWISGSLIDSKTLEILFSSGLNPRPRDETAVYDYQGPIWHDAPVSLLLEFAWGEFIEAEGPAILGTTLRVPGAMAGLFALQNGSQRGASFGRDDPGYVISRFVETAADKPGCIGICGFVPFWRGRSTDLELVDRNGKLAVSAAWNGSDYVFAALFNGVRAEDAAIFRMKTRPHWARAIIELPGLPDLPNSHAQLTNLFDLKVPFAKFGKLSEMLRYISCAAQIGPLDFTDLDERSGVAALEFPREYRDVPLRDMLRDITDAADVSVRIDPETLHPIIERRG